MALRDGTPSMMGISYPDADKLCFLTFMKVTIDSGSTVGGAVDEWIAQSGMAAAAKSEHARRRKTLRRRYYDWLAHFDRQLDPRQTWVPRSMRLLQKSIVQADKTPVPMDCDGVRLTPSFKPEAALRAGWPVRRS